MAQIESCVEDLPGILTIDAGIMGIQIKYTASKAASGTPEDILLQMDIQMLLLAVSPEKADIDWCIEHNAGINFCYAYLALSAPAISYARKNDVKIGVWTVDNIVFEDIMVLFGAEIITTNKLLPVTEG